MTTERRCHYEVLGLERDCTAEQIKAAYRKLALQRHPDKLIRSGVSQSEANALFQELGHAYEVLSDPRERAWYDSHRSQILFSDPSSSSSAVPDLFSFFSTAVFSGYADHGQGFYKVYSDVFAKIYNNELNFARKLGLGMDAVKGAPMMGNLNSEWAQTTAFYGYWLGFSTVMDFNWVEEYNAAAGANRKSRRVMEEENKKLRRKAKREYNETVRGLAEFVKKRDKRVMDMAVKREEERERKKAEERERRRKEEREKMERAMAYEDPEWARAEEEVDEDEEEEEGGKRKEEFYCVLCGKKFKSDKQWKNHEQSKKHKEKVAEFRDSIGDEEEELEKELDGGVDELSEGVREGLGIGEEERVGANGGEDEFYDFDGENGREKVSESDGGDDNGNDDDDDDDKGEEEDDEMDALLAMAARQKSRGKHSELEVDEEDDEMDALLAMAARQKSREKLAESDGGDENEKEENVGEAVGVDEGDSDGDTEDDEVNVVEAMGQKSKKDAAVRVENEDPSLHVEDDGNDMPMEYDNKKSTRRTKKGKSKKSGGESKKVLKDENDNGQSEIVSDNENSNVKEPASDPVVENESKDKENDQLARKKKTSKQPVEKKEKVKKEARSKISTRGKKAKAKNSSNSCEACGEEFESRNLLHKHISDTGHASLKNK